MTRAPPPRPGQNRKWKNLNADAGLAKRFVGAIQLEARGPQHVVLPPRRPVGGGDRLRRTRPRRRAAAAPVGPAAPLRRGRVWRDRGGVPAGGVAGRAAVDRRGVGGRGGATVGEVAGMAGGRRWIGAGPWPHRAAAAAVACRRWTLRRRRVCQTLRHIMLLLPYFGEIKIYIIIIFICPIIQQYAHR